MITQKIVYELKISVPNRIKILLKTQAIKKNFIFKKSWEIKNEWIFLLKKFIKNLDKFIFFCNGCFDLSKWQYNVIIETSYACWINSGKTVVTSVLSMCDCVCVFAAMWIGKRANYFAKIELEYFEFGGRSHKIKEKKQKKNFPSKIKMSIWERKRKHHTHKIEQFKEIQLISVTAATVL